MGCCGNYEKDKVSKNDDDNQDLKYKINENSENLSNLKDQQKEKVKDIEKERKKPNENEIEINKKEDKEINKVDEQENEDEKKIDSENNESVKSNSDDNNQLLFLLELVKFLNQNEQENEYNENDISNNEKDNKINNELDKVFKHNFIYYPKMNFLSLCKFLELDVDKRKKEEIIKDDILKNNEEKINNLYKDIKDFRNLNLLVLCNNDDQMK